MGKLSVLIVEDEFLVGADIEESLIVLGYEVQKCVASGLAAIAEVERKLPDIILMDIRLKGEMTGIEAAKLIREKHDVPVIYLTANADIGTIEQAKVSLPYGYIIKPFTEKDLQTNIEIARFKFENDIQIKIESDQYNALFKKGERDQEVIFVEGESGLEKINPADVYYVESTDKHCIIHLRESTLLVNKSLDQLERKFPKDQFIRVNAHHLINKNKIFLAKAPEIIIADKMAVITVDDEHMSSVESLF
jgi:two-component system, LytTR family, response regulator LytT